jgi:hypothetical protein
MIDLGVLGIRLAIKKLRGVPPLESLKYWKSRNQVLLFSPLVFMCHGFWENSGHCPSNWGCFQDHILVLLCVVCQCTHELLNLQASSCHRPFTRTLSKTTGFLFSCLQGVADALPGMARTMQIIIIIMNSRVSTGFHAHMSLTPNNEIPSAKARHRLGRLKG